MVNGKAWSCTQSNAGCCRFRMTPKPTLRLLHLIAPASGTDDVLELCPQRGQTLPPHTGCIPLRGAAAPCSCGLAGAHMNVPYLAGLHASVLCMPVCCLQMQGQCHGIWVADTLRPQCAALKWEGRAGCCSELADSQAVPSHGGTVQHLIGLCHPPGDCQPLQRSLGAA